MYSGDGIEDQLSLAGYITLETKGIHILFPEVGPPLLSPPYPSRGLLVPLHQAMDL